MDMSLHKTVLFVIDIKDECHWAESLRVPQKYYAYLKLALNVKTCWAKHIKKLQSNAANFQVFSHLWDIALTYRWKSNKELEIILSHYIKIWDRLSILAGFHPQALYNDAIQALIWVLYIFLDSAWSNLTYITKKNWSI